MLRTVTMWVVTFGILAGCNPPPPAADTSDVAAPASVPQENSEESAPVETSESADSTTSVGSEMSGPLSESSEKPEFVTAAQLRERLGVGDTAHFERVGRGFVAAYLANTGVKDLTPLKGQSLQLLAIAQNPVASLSGVEGMPLVVLDLSKTKIISLAPLQDCSTLSQIGLESTDVKDLSPLKGKRLTHLYVIGCPIEDLTPLAGMQLQELNLCGTPITSLNGLKDVQAGILWLRDTAVTDITPLADMELTSLDLQGTEVADLSPLKSIGSLQRLNIAETPVTDVTPLAGLPLSRLIFSPERITAGLDLIRKMPTLREIDTQFEGDQPKTMTASEFWERYDAGEFKTESPETR